MKKRLLISFSGGRSSAFMTWWLLNRMRDKYEMKVVFANTGKEREETLEFIRECDIRFGFDTVWIESVTNMTFGCGVSFRLVDFDSANRQGGPFEDFIKKHGIPNQAAPNCSRELKGNAIRAYARSIGWKGYFTAIGIRADESHRINITRAGRERLVYPLAILLRATKSDVNLFWCKQSFDLRLKSYEGNCDLCWKKSIRKLMTLVKERPALADWWREMERKYENYIPEQRKGNVKIKKPLRFFRDNMAVDEIIEDAGFDFTPAIDESRQIDAWKQLAFFNAYLDLEDSGCTQSCEAFG